VTNDNTGTDAGTGDNRTERKQRLDTSMDHAKASKLRGRLDQRLADAFGHRDGAVEQDTGRFHRAIEEGWEMHYAVATSGAHGWQIESDGGLRLAEGAYPEDLSWLVFENGWVHSTGAQWLKNDDLAEWVADLQERRDTVGERINNQESEVFESDDRIRQETDSRGKEITGWWRFEPTGYVGRPPAVTAHAEGYDASPAMTDDD
jgi:hypothetical protein